MYIINALLVKNNFLDTGIKILVFFLMYFYVQFFWKGEIYMYLTLFKYATSNEVEVQIFA